MKRSQHMNCRNGSSSNMPWLWKYQMQAAKVKTRGKCSLFTFYVCVMNVQALNSTLVNILIDHTFTRGILAKLKQGWKLRISNVDICYLNLSFRACSHEARYLGWHAGISMLAGISRVPEISRCARVSLFWKLVRSHETGITRGAEISRLDYPGYPVNRDNYYPCERSAPGYLGGAGTTSTVMRMNSIRTWKPTWWKLQVPNVNTHNMQEEIHSIDIERTTSVIYYSTHTRENVIYLLSSVYWVV